MFPARFLRKWKKVSLLLCFCSLVFTLLINLTMLPGGGFVDLLRNERSEVSGPHYLPLDTRSLPSRWFGVDAPSGENRTHQVGIAHGHVVSETDSTETRASRAGFKNGYLQALLNAEILKKTPKRQPVIDPLLDRKLFQTRTESSDEKVNTAPESEGEIVQIKNKISQMMAEFNKTAQGLVVQGEIAQQLESFRRAEGSYGAHEIRQSKKFHENQDNMGAGHGESSDSARVSTQTEDKVLNHTGTLGGVSQDFTTRDGQSVEQRGGEMVTQRDGEMVTQRDGEMVTQRDGEMVTQRDGQMVTQVKPWPERETRVVEVSKSVHYGDVQQPMFKAYGQPGDPGEFGVGVIYPTKDLTPLEKQERTEQFAIHSFDAWISDKISVRRALNDGRIPECKNQSLPSTIAPVSVLVVFHNEAWSVLLRTLHSILDRSPTHMLAELVLLDDFSNLPHLGDPLASYVQQLDKVRLLRTTERLGLIRARNAIFQHSTGEIVVFLDSHVECFPGWLEHLVSPILSDFRTVTFPVIEIINEKTFRLMQSKHPTFVGGLDLKTLNFQWLVSRPVERTKPASDIPSPTMPGGLYAVSRRWFDQLGQYDPGLLLWGGENIEMSFKTWMCGGRIVQVSCSHVGHVFRKTNPAFKARSSSPGHRNSVRVAEVWMDHFKHFFYENIAYNINYFGDVSARVKLRQRLKCHNFSWYVDNVFPELKATINLAGVYSGTISNVGARLCLDRSDDHNVRLHQCNSHSIYQLWKMSPQGQLTSGDRAVGVSLDTHLGRHKPRLGIFRTFNKNLNVDFQFVYDQRSRLVHKASGLCLHAETARRNVVLLECSLSSIAQRWKHKTRKQLQSSFKTKGVSIDWSV